MILGLTIILILVLFLPFTVKIVERNLEVFLFIMGISAVLVSQVLDTDLILKALEDPVHITLAVIIAGLLFRWLRTPFEKGILGMSKAIPFRLFLALIVIVLGITIKCHYSNYCCNCTGRNRQVYLRLDRKSEIRLVIIACYSIGLGAVLTPIGEPLSTIATSKLNEDFFYLLRLIGPDIIPGVIAFGILAAIIIKPSNKLNRLKAIKEQNLTLKLLFGDLKSICLSWL